MSLSILPAPGPLPSLVLIVDDDQDTRDLYSLVFELAGLRTAAGGTIRDALEIAHRLLPSVVVTDWMLPDGNGLHLCEALHRSGRTRRIPKIAVTGTSFDATGAERARASGCERILQKPVSPDVLVEAVGRALDLRTTRALRAAAVRIRRDAYRVRRLSVARRRTLDELRVVARELLDRNSARRATGVALILADDDGHYVAANAGASELTGYDAQELVQLSVSDLTPPAQEIPGASLWNRFLQDGSQEGRFLVRTRSGEAVEASYVAVANIAPGLHLSALTSRVHTRA